MNEFRADKGVLQLGYLCARVGDVDIDGVIWNFGVPGVNYCGERFIEMYCELGLLIWNTFF